MSISVKDAAGDVVVIETLPALGAALAAACLPVVLASDHPAVPVTKQDVAANGTITTQNLVPAGVATAGSAVEISTQGKGTVSIQTVGTYTGALSIQARVAAAAPWVTLSGGSTLIRDTGAYSATIASAAQGIFQLDCAAFSDIRVTALAAVTGSVAVYLRAMDAIALTALDTALPAGSASLGSVGLNAGTNAIGGVTLRPDTGQGASTTHRQALVANITNGAPTSVKNGAGVVNACHIANNCGVGVWVHFYNKASAPTLGTDTPVCSVFVKAGETFPVDTGVFGNRFSTGIAYAVCDNCATVPAVGGTITIASTAAAICISLFYT